MNKLLTLLDKYLLKWGVLFAFAFIALYPKLPSIHIIRTWVYIRLEDFVIASLVLIWIVQLLRKKVRLPLPVGIPIGVYWLIGLISLLISLLFVGPHLVGFFPHLAILEYLRRIEYMMLFFIAFSTIRSQKDLRDFLVALCVTVGAVVVYGFGQRFYLTLWALFPKFFEHASFCFPSFQTGNEEFAKGLALCLPQEARITSTFGGHYDLAAYLVVILPILVALFVSAKKVAAKIGVGVLFVTSLMLLIFTASRVSFLAYLLGGVIALILMKKRVLIIPLVVISVLCLMVFNGSTAKRFMQTFRIVNVVTNNQGQVVGMAENNLPDSLKKKIAKNDSVIVEAPPPTQNLPTGSSFITLSQTAKTTSSAYIKSAIPTSEAQKLKLAAGGFEISTVSGNFLIQKAIVYDISFTTRFQAEWPNAWSAFMSDPLFGKGYSTITLATDNDYLRLLGESGLLGFLSFGLIFVVFAIYLSYAAPESDRLSAFVAYGLTGGIVGLIFNAGLIDVFEASKVAEPLWILLGVIVGALSLGFHGRIAYVAHIKKIVSSHLVLILLLGILAFLIFGGGLSNFFVGDDFVWLKWAAIAHPGDVVKYFFDAQGSIYRPIAKIIMIVMYSVFSFQPVGYHVVGMFVHIFIGIGIYLLGLLLFRRKIWAWLMSALYIISPAHAEVLFWISTLSISWSTLFIVFALVTYGYFRKYNWTFLYGISLGLGLISPFTYEMGIVVPLLLVIIDVFFITKKLTKKTLLLISPFVVFEMVYLFVRSHAHVSPMSGDYSYNLTHLLPNTIANFTTYLVAAFVGERATAWQFIIRQSLKAHSLPISIGFLVSVALFGWGTWVLWKKANKELVNELSGAVSFAFVALLPFLGLGNTDERYMYLSVLGIAFVVVIFSKYLWTKTQGNMYIKVILVCIAAAFFLYAKDAVAREQKQWAKASEVTYNTLAYFRVVKEYLPSHATLYISNMPTRFGNAWVFPVGMEEGLWFVYRDDTIKIVKTKSVDESLQIKHSHPSEILNHEYVFDFDKNGVLSEY